MVSHRKHRHQEVGIIPAKVTLHSLVLGYGDHSRTFPRLQGGTSKIILGSVGSTPHMLHLITELVQARDVLPNLGLVQTLKGT